MTAPASIDASASPPDAAGPPRDGSSRPHRVGGDANPRPRRHRNPPRPAAGVLVLAGLLVVLVWLVAGWLAPRVQLSPGWQDLARFAHLAALVLGFGAALTVEWFGLLWLLGRRSLTAVTQVAQGAHLPIWLGLAGLTASGVALSPSPLTTAGIVKLVVVLLVALNGIYALRVQHHLTQAKPVVPRRVLARVAGTATVSQLGWWCAVVIGFLSSQGS